MIVNTFHIFFYIFIVHSLVQFNRAFEIYVKFFIIDTIYII